MRAGHFHADLRQEHEVVAFFRAADEQAASLLQILDRAHPVRMGVIQVVEELLRQEPCSVMAGEAGEDFALELRQPLPACCEVDASPYERIGDEAGTNS